MTLDGHGIAALVQIVLYAHTAVLALAPVLLPRGRRGLGAGRKVGWVLLSVLSAVQIGTGAAVLVAALEQTNAALRSTAAFLDAICLCLLLNAALSFLETVGQFTLENTMVLRVGTGIFRLITTVSVVLIAVGALEFGLAVDQDHLDDATTVQRVGYIFMIAGLGGVMGIAGYCAFNVKQILKYRRRFLWTVVVSIPFLLLRVLYSVLGGFADPLARIDASGNRIPLIPHDTLQSFQLTTGSLEAFIVMDITMQYIAVLMYITAGVLLPLRKDQFVVERVYRAAAGIVREGSERAIELQRREPEPGVRSMHAELTLGPTERAPPQPS